MIWELAVASGAIVCGLGVWFAHPVCREKLVARGRVKDRDLTWQSRERLVLTTATAILVGCVGMAGVYVKSLFSDDTQDRTPPVVEREFVFQPPVALEEAEEVEEEEDELELDEEQEQAELPDSATPMQVYRDVEPDTGEEGSEIEEGASEYDLVLTEDIPGEDEAQGELPDKADQGSVASPDDKGSATGGGTGEGRSVEPDRRVLTRRNFQITLKGTVGGKYPIVMKLTSKGRVLSGTYYDEERLKERTIAGKLERNGKCIIRGYAERDRLVSVFRGFFDNRRFVGKCRNSETGVTVPFALTAERETPPIRSFLGKEK
jgi:hypothetical protein